MMQTLPPPVPNTVELNLDAAGIYDSHDAPSAMEVKWDFDNDGNYDTQYSSNKTADFSYTVSDEPHFIRMMVRDNEGLTDEVILLVPEKIFIPASDFKNGSVFGIRS